MLAELDNRDWNEVFGFAPEGITREDVSRIIAIRDGENDGPSWLGLFQLNDGRFLYLHAGCCYTGWECNSSGDGAVCEKLNDLLLGHVGEENAQVLEIMFLWDQAIQSQLKILEQEHAPIDETEDQFLEGLFQEASRKVFEESGDSKSAFYAGLRAVFNHGKEYT